MISNFVKLQCNDKSLVVPIDYNGSNELFVNEFNVLLEQLDTSKFVQFSLAFYNDGLLIGGMTYKSAGNAYCFTYTSGYECYDKFFDDFAKKLSVKPIKSDI